MVMPCLDLIGCNAISLDGLKDIFACVAPMARFLCEMAIGRDGFQMTMLTSVVHGGE